MDGTTSKVSFLLKAPPILYWFPGAVTTKYHKLGVFEKTEIYCLTVLQAGNPKLRCQQGYVLSEICRDEFPLASSSFWWCLSVFGSSLQSPSPCACLHVNVCPLIRTHWITAHLMISLHLITSARSYFQISSHSQGLGVRTSTYVFGGHNSSHKGVHFFKFQFSFSRAQHRVLDV